MGQGSKKMKLVTLCSGSRSMEIPSRRVMRLPKRCSWWVAKAVRSNIGFQLFPVVVFQTADLGVQVAPVGFAFGHNGLWQCLGVWKVDGLGETGLKILIELLQTLEL